MLLSSLLLPSDARPKILEYARGFFWQYFKLRGDFSGTGSILTPDGRPGAKEGLVRRNSEVGLGLGRLNGALFLDIRVALPEDEEGVLAEPNGEIN